MKINYKGHSRRTKKASGLWLKMAEDYDNDISPAQIAEKYTNPKTNKPYTRGHVYWVLTRLKKIKSLSKIKK